MVLDESALEAMLARQRAAERSHEHAPAVRTVKTDEFEVYERQPDTAPRPDAAQRPQPPAAPARPTTPAHRTPAPGPQATDFEELPGREPEAPSPAWHAPPLAPQAPAWPADVPVPEPAPAAQQAAQAPERSTPAPTAAATHPAAPPPVRRPQVWPPIRPERSAVAAPSATPQPASTTRPGAIPGSDSMPGPGAIPGPASLPERTPPEARQPIFVAADQPPRHGAPASDVDAVVAPRSHAPRAAGAGDGGAGPPPGNGCRLAIVQAMFNAEITDAMTQQAIARGQSAGAQVTRHQVPGVYDLPLTVQHLARRRDVDAIVVIGCVVQGQTKHDELITFTTAKTLQEISLATDTPISLGITGPGMTWQQAQARIGNGAHAVDAALVMWQALQNA